MKIATLLRPIPAFVVLVSVQPAMVFAQPSSPDDPFFAEVRFSVSVAKKAKEVFVKTLKLDDLKPRRNGGCREDTQQVTDPDFPRKIKPGGVEYERLFYRCLTPKDSTYVAFAKASEAAAEEYSANLPSSRKRRAVRVVVDTYEQRLGAGGDCQIQRCPATGDIDAYTDPGACTSCQ